MGYVPRTLHQCPDLSHAPAQVDKLRQQQQDKAGERVALDGTPIATLWERDLDRFLAAYEVRCGPQLVALGGI